MNAPVQTQTHSPEQTPGMYQLPRGVKNLETFRPNGREFVVGERFQIEKRLTPINTSASANSVVYEAIDLERLTSEDSSPDPDSVIKILLDSTEAKMLAGTIETEIAKELPEHENIVKSVGQGEMFTQEGKSFRFLAFERTNYGTLKRPSKELSEAQMIDVIGGVARAMSHIHAHGLVHKDIKSDNIGLHQTETGVIIPKILDFGATRPIEDDLDKVKISRSEEFDQAVRRLNEMSVIQFSPAFVSPEARKKGEITGASDVYSLGRSILEIYDFLGTVGNYRIIDDTGEVEIEVEADPRILPSRIPPRIGTIACECLDLDPKNRLKPTEIEELLYLTA